MIDVPATTGGRLALALQLLGRSQAEAAEALDVSRTYINNVVKDRSPPSDRLLNRLLDVLGVTPEWIRYGRGEPLVGVRRPDPTAVPTVTNAQPEAAMDEAAARRTIATLQLAAEQVRVLAGLDGYGTADGAAIHRMLDRAVPHDAPPERRAQVRGYLQALIDSDEAAARLGRDSP